MKEQKNSMAKENVATGVSSTIGAAVGVVAGNMVTEEISASEVHNVPGDDVPVVESNTAGTHTTPAEEYHPVVEDVTPVPEPTPEPEPIPEPEPEPMPEPEPEPTPVVNPDPNVSVLAYQTVTNEDGSLSDVALVDVNGQSMVVVDGDRDGLADVMAADVNGNGVLDDGELYDLSDQNVEMSVFQDAYLAGQNGGGYIEAQAEGPDYVNNADVDNYMA